ncbi:MAG: ABC transporter permease, partial [Burkholderiaceae bacterium]|nr:ABC transporter permease [Burkholderiaceae bacterium]
MAASATPIEVRGRLTRVAGLVMEAVGLKLPVGAQVTVLQDASLRVDAEVVGFNGERLFLMPATDPYGLRPGAMVVAHESAAARPRLHRNNYPRRRAEDRTRHLPMGDALLGRVVDPNGRPLDRLGALEGAELQPLARRPINAMEREPVRSPLDVGVRAINALATVGRGQRMGLFAGSGVGKSVLLGMMAKYTSADVTVVGLIGERGREVKEFIEDILGPQGLRRAVVVAAPALRGTGQVVAGNANWSTQFFGTTNDYLIARDWPLAAGRAFEPAEIAGSAKVALIGQTTAKQLFGEGVDPIDQVIRVRKVPLTVIGVLERKGQNALGQDQDDIVLMPIAT